MKKGSKQSSETIDKIRKAKLAFIANNPTKAFLISSNAGKKGGAASSGYTHSPEIRKKMSENRKGKYTGSNNHKWAGNHVSYGALHKWVARYLGHPDTCENCKSQPQKNTRRRVQWANLSKKYLRIKKDWMALCVPCHKAFDLGKLKII